MTSQCSHFPAIFAFSACFQAVFSIKNPPQNYEQLLIQTKYLKDVSIQDL